MIPNEVDAVESLAAQDDPRVLRAVEEYLAACQAGVSPDRQAFLARHAEIAAAVADCLDGLDFILQAGVPLRPFDDAGVATTAATTPGAPLGDFRIMREVGRGGMGVVYEAEQISLRRRVALKVLPFAATMDPKQLQRFKNEAQAAAHLHHPNIVQVHATGCERGVHYYAMQFIEGHTLVVFIAQLRAQAQREHEPAETRTTSFPAAPVLPSGQQAPPEPAAFESQANAPRAEQLALPPALLQETSPVAGLATERTTGRTSFFQLVARLGIQAAEALEHAHQVGIVHRDIKPANLLVDGRGNLWVTDFGLAHCQSQAGLTMSGDLVGTLRYMSPEQALGQRTVIDHRTDIYSLGVTLYELLSLQPPFAGNDRQELLRQIAFEEPKAPQRLNRAIPDELETIVLKAMEKNPADRYAAAQDLADDLRRFLEDKPIWARRPTLWQIAKKWVRRNRSVVWMASIFSLVAVAILAGCVGWVVRDRAARQAVTAAQAKEALQEATRLRDQGNWPEALSATKRAQGILATGAEAELEQRAEELRRDLEMVIQLDDVRIRDGVHDLYGFGYKEMNQAYLAVFRAHGIDLMVLKPAQTAELIRIKSSYIQHEVITSLDHWAFLGCNHPSQRTQLLAIARAVDSDEWRNQLRDALEWGDGRVLKQMAASALVVDLPASSRALLGFYLARTGAVDDAIAVLRRGQRRFIADFWINVSLAEWLQVTNPPQFDEAIGFYRAALALRPNSGSLHYYFGTALRRKGLLNEAESAYRQAIELEPGLADAHSSLVGLLVTQGKVLQADEACAEARKRIPHFARWLNNRAWHIVNFPDHHRRDFPLAIACAKKAIEIAPDVKYAWNTLGAAYYRAGKWDKAITALEKSMEIRQGGDGFDWIFLAMAHLKQGHEQEARRWYDQAVEWIDKNKPMDEELHRFRDEAGALLQIAEQKTQPKGTRGTKKTK